MALRLISIQFSGLSQDEPVIPLRKNSEFDPEPGPEWQAGNGASGVQSRPVAYRLDKAGAGVDIRVTFDTTGGSFDVRAADATGSNLLGAVPEFHISHNGPGNVSATIRVPAPALAPAGVSKHEDCWRWTARDSAGTEVMSTLTRHMVYTVLSAPGGPWNLQDPSGLPWTDALDIACEWARGRRTELETASAITEEVFQLGKPAAKVRFAYASGPSYTRDVLGPRDLFGCIDFIETLNESRRFGSRTLNCSDSAAILTTFANVLGCQLVQVEVFPGPTKQVQFLGEESLRTDTFGFHQIASTGVGNSDDPVWDGCVAFGSDLNPAALPVPAVQLPFDDGTNDCYINRLEDNRNAGIMAKLPGKLDPSGNRSLQRLLSSQPVPLPGFLRQLERFLPGELEARKMNGVGQTEAYSIIYRPPLSSRKESWIEINIESTTGEDADQILRKIRKSYSTGLQEVNDLGDIAFRSSRRGEVVFTVGPYVVHVRNPGLNPASISWIPYALARYFRKHPE